MLINSLSVSSRKIQKKINSPNSGIVEFPRILQEFWIHEFPEF